MAKSIVKLGLLALLAVPIVVYLYSCHYACTNNTADKRIRELLSIPENAVLNEETVSHAVLNQVSIGESDEAIENKMRALGIGDGKHSIYVPLNRERKVNNLEKTALIVVPLDAYTCDFPKHEWFISLHFNGMNRLERVSVRQRTALP